MSYGENIVYDLEKPQGFETDPPCDHIYSVLWPYMGRTIYRWSKISWNDFFRMQYLKQARGPEVSWQQLESDFHGL